MTHIPFCCIPQFYIYSFCQNLYFLGLDYYQINSISLPIINMNFNSMLHREVVFSVYGIVGQYTGSFCIMTHKPVYCIPQFYTYILFVRTYIARASEVWIQIQCYTHIHLFSWTRLHMVSRSSNGGEQVLAQSTAVITCTCASQWRSSIWSRMLYGHV